MLFVLDFFDRDLFVLINQRWASVSLDPMMIFLSSKWAFVPLYIVFFGSIYQTVWKEILDTHFAHAEFVWAGG